MFRCPNGELVAAGNFTTMNGVPAQYIARWDGVDWRPLGNGVTHEVYALTVYNGELIAGGRFTSAGGEPARFIARWDGAAWLPLGSGVNRFVRTLMVHDGELIVGGNFTTAGGNISAHWARWGVDCAPGDADCDDDVDFDDFTLFAGCMSGPGVDDACGSASGVCADIDRDGDLDLADFGDLQLLLGQP